MRDSRQSADGNSLGRELALIYEERLDEFCSVAAAITRDGSSARDIVHEAFVSALRKAERFRGEGELSAWVWRIVVNASHDHLRRQKRIRSVVDAEEPGRSDPSLASADGLDLTERIQSLPERQRLAIFLRYYADLDYRQIAEVLQVAPGTVSAALAAAHKTLRDQMTEGYK